MMTDVPVSMALTSGLTTRLMRSLPITVGVKDRLTPNGLNSTVIVVPPASVSWATGTGNSPPARKLAVSPDRAMRLGSARVLSRPFFSSASKSTAMAKLPVDRARAPARKPAAASPERPTFAAVPGIPAVPGTAAVPAISAVPGTAAVPAISAVAIAVAFPDLAPTAKVLPESKSSLVLRPNSFTTVRCTSTKRTARSTCWLPFTLRRLVTRPGAYRSDTASACVSFAELDTVPLRMTESLTPRTSISSSGNSSNNRDFSPLMS